jgi:outer membrane protein
MKKVTIGAFLILIVMAVGSNARGADSIKIGFVDMQRALNACEAGKEAKQIIAQEVEKMQKAMTGRQKELEKLREDLEKRAAVMSEAVRKEKERDYQTKLRDMQRLQRDFEEDIRRKDQEYTERILKELALIIRKLAEEKQYTLVVEKNQPAVLFVQGSLDLTDEVIQIINQKLKGAPKMP